METYKAISTRRSTRKYNEKPISKELLEMIIKAGRLAPCGGNSQSTHFIVISNPKVLHELATIVQEEFAKMEVTKNMYRSLQSTILASKSRHYPFSLQRTSADCNGQSEGLWK